MKDYLTVANDPVLWLMALPAVAIVAIQAVIFSRRAFKTAKIVSMTRQECWKALRVGIISAIGPAVAVFIVMLGMMAVVGAPITWLRLSFIGVASTELTGAQMGAQASQVEFGGQGYDLIAFSASVWTMTLNTCGWLLFCGLFTPKLDMLRNKLADNDTKLMGELGGGAMVGVMAFLTGEHLIADNGRLAASVVAGAVMIALIFLSKKVEKISEYTLGISMICGLAAATLIFGK